MWVFLLLCHLYAAVPYSHLKEIRQTIRDNRRQYIANAKMFERIMTKVDFHANYTKSIARELSQVKQSLQQVQEENQILKTELTKLQVNQTSDYDYGEEYFVDYKADTEVDRILSRITDEVLNSTKQYVNSEYDFIKQELKQSNEKVSSLVMTFNATKQEFFSGKLFQLVV